MLKTIKDFYNSSLPRFSFITTPHSRFDLVCNSQHGTVERPFEWWQTTFRASIAAIGRVALVLAPWEDPIPLTRCWCLFEIFTAVAAGEGEVELQVRLPASQRPAFVEALAGDFEVVMDTLVRVESQRALLIVVSKPNSHDRAALCRRCFSCAR